MFAQGYGEGTMGELLFNGNRVSGFQDEKVLESDCTTMWM